MNEEPGEYKRKYARQPGAGLDLHQVEQREEQRELRRDSENSADASLTAGRPFSRKTFFSAQWNLDSAPS